MKIDEAINLSLLMFIQRRIDAEAKMVTGWRPVHGGEFVCVSYTHSGITRDIRMFTYHADFRTMFEQLDLDLMGES